MDREHIKGAADKVKGAIKDTAGKLTGDKKLQSEGKFDKAKGSVRNLAGDVKECGPRCVEDGRRLRPPHIARQELSRPNRAAFLFKAFNWSFQIEQ